jgi:DNA polymerase-3 subunit delta
MPIYFYWGEDDFTLNQAVHHLRDRVLNLPLVSFSLKNKKLNIWIFFF